jgi:hypothetical protein
MTFILDILEFAVYFVLAISLVVHLRREPDVKLRHITIAFVVAALGFLFNIVDDLIYFSGQIEMAKWAFKLFDICLMIGAFYFFVFLSDFNERLKKLLPVWIAALIAVIVAILFADIVWPIAGKFYEGQGAFWTVFRQPYAGYALVLFWTVTFVTISASFIRYAALAESGVAKSRMWFLALGGIAAVLSYLSAVVFKVFFKELLIEAEIMSSTLAMIAGIFFYLGAEMPARLKKAFE